MYGQVRIIGLPPIPKGAKLNVGRTVLESKKERRGPKRPVSRPVNQKAIEAVSRMEARINRLIE